MQLLEHQSHATKYTIHIRLAMHSLLILILGLGDFDHNTLQRLSTLNYIEGPESELSLNTTNQLSFDDVICQNLYHPLLGEAILLVNLQVVDGINQAAKVVAFHLVIIILHYLVTINKILLSGDPNHRIANR